MGKYELMQKNVDLLDGLYDEACREKEILYNALVLLYDRADDDFSASLIRQCFEAATAISSCLPQEAKTIQYWLDDAIECGSLSAGPVTVRFKQTSIEPASKTD